MILAKGIIPSLVSVIKTETFIKSGSRWAINVLRRKSSGILFVFKIYRLCGRRYRLRLHGSFARATEHE
jgi:hypothetical protein